MNIAQNERNEDFWFGQVKTAYAEKTHKQLYSTYKENFIRTNTDPKKKSDSYFVWLLKTLKVPGKYWSWIGKRFSNQRRAPITKAPPPSPPISQEERDLNIHREKILTALGNGSYELGVYFEELYLYG